MTTAFSPLAPCLPPIGWLKPREDARMRAMAKRIGGDQRHVFAYGIDLYYYRVKNQILDWDLHT